MFRADQQLLFKLPSGSKPVGVHVCTRLVSFQDDGFQVFELLGRAEHGLSSINCQTLPRSIHMELSAKFDGQWNFVWKIHRWLYCYPRHETDPVLIPYLSIDALILCDITYPLLSQLECGFNWIFYVAVSRNLRQPSTTLGDNIGKMFIQHFMNVMAILIPNVGEWHCHNIHT